MQGLSEALHFADKAGLDGRAVVEVISQGAAGSWQMANRYETMLDDHFEHGFAVDWMRKDLGICLDTANETGASLPVTALVDQFYKDVQKLGVVAGGIRPRCSNGCGHWTDAKGGCLPPHRAKARFPPEDIFGQMKRITVRSCKSVDGHETT